jgi:hypothetical protein
MDKSNQDPNKQESKQPFVSKEDRPDVRINLDTPLQDLRVRELGAILGFFATRRYDLSGDPLKDFFDKPFPEVAKDKEFKDKDKDLKDDADFKYNKDFKDKAEKMEKNEKNEKVEKRELKEIKNEKLEREPVFEQGFQGPGPELQHVVQALSGLTKQVSQLANQMEELRKKVEGKS